ncbi:MULTISPECIES: restriction endonuclease subunit S [Bacillus cereus group]|nr:MULTISPECIES: restriction endonuclease subunit S [Bacillus cereus group]
MKKNNYFSNKWSSLPLGELATLGRKSGVTKVDSEQFIELSRVTHRDLSSDSYVLNQKQSQEEYVYKGDVIYGDGTILVSLNRIHRGIGLLRTQAVVSMGICGIKISSEKVSPEYLFYYLLWLRKYLPKHERWTINYLKSLMIPLPPDHVQQHIVTLLSKINAINEKNRKAIMLIDIYITALYLSQFKDDKKGGIYEERTLREYVEEIEFGASFRKNESLLSAPILKGRPNLALFEVWEENWEKDDIVLKNAPLARFGDILCYIKGDKDSKEPMVIVHTWSYPIAFSNEWVRIKPLSHMSSEYLAAFLRAEYSKVSLTLRTCVRKDLSNNLLELPIYIPTEINQRLFTSMVRKINNISKMHHKSLIALDILNSVLNDRFFH